MVGYQGTKIRSRVDLNFGPFFNEDKQLQYQTSKLWKYD